MTGTSSGTPNTALDTAGITMALLLLVGASAVLARRSRHGDNASGQGLKSSLTLNGGGQ